MSESETEANARKNAIDTLAAELVNLDQDQLKKSAKLIADIIRRVGKEKKICICGGAGSGKTTIAARLSSELEIPTFDLDEFIKGGWTPDQQIYSKRLSSAFHDVWQKMPKQHWILEHVEACHPDIVKLFGPSFFVLVDPDESRLRRTAEVRDMISGEENSGRLKRALQSAKMAKKQFEEIKGQLLRAEKNWVLLTTQPGPVR